MATRRLVLGLMATSVAALGGLNPAHGCTALVASGPATVSGAPMLWKNRDTGTLSNKLLFVDGSPLGYLCLANADSDSGRFCYAGLNRAGFAIINTVAYNLPSTTGELADLEGQIMAEALRTCRTVDDFARFLEANLGPDLGSQATFGVLDGSGAAAVFEVANHGFERLDTVDQPGSRLVVTNFARSGAENEGEGYLRFARASELVAAFAPGTLDPEVVLHGFSRDLGHVLLDHPSLASLAEQPAAPSRWISGRDCIDRPSTAAAVVIVGASPVEPPRPPVLWVIPGEPLTAVAVPVWVDAGSSPAALWAGDEAPLWAASARLKRVLRPATAGHQEDYLDLTRLDNAEGTGFLPGLLAAERAIFAATEAFLAEPRSPEELAAFQDEMADKALAAITAAAGS